MSFHAALSGAQLTKLRGSAAVPATYACAQHISVLRPATMLKCRVNGTPTGTSFAAISFDTVTTGAYTNVIAGMTVLISHTDDQRAAFFVGRARSATASALNINETSAGILDNDYVWVIQDWRLQIKLAREVAGVQYKDWDVAYAGQKPIIYNLQSAYAGWVDATSGVLSISFAPLDFAAESGATISTRVWSTLPSGATLTAGSLSGANITVEFDPGDYWLEYTVTDSGGRAQVRHIPIFAHDDSINPPALSMSGASTQGNAAGWAGSLRGYNGIDDLLDGTLVVVWNEEIYNGTAGSLFSNIAGVFRFRQESDEGKSDPTHSFVTDTGFELEDIATQLSRLYCARLGIDNISSPTLWDQINDLTPYRAMVHILETASTFNTIHSLSFDTFDGTFEYDEFPSTGSLLSSCTDIAKSINAVLEFAPDGRCIVSRHACHLTTAQRNALTTIANFTDGSSSTLSDIIDLTYVHGHTRDIGQMNGAGGTYNTTTGMVDAFISISPGVAQEGGSDTRAISGQILAANSDAETAKAELITRSANELEIANGPDKLIIVFPDGYHFLIPSVAQWYTFTLASTTNKRGVTFDTNTRWWLESISIEQDNDTGTKNVRATFVRETVGAGGIAFEAPKPGEIAPYVPDLPAFGPYDFAFPELPSLYLADNPSGIDVPVATITPPSAPAGTASVPRDGNTQIIWDTGYVWVTREYLKSANPRYTDVTPDTTHTVQYADLDPFPDSAGHVGAYVLTTSGDYSYIWHTTNVFAGDVAWTQGGAIRGTFTELHTTSTKGHVLIKAPDVTATGYPISLAMTCTTNCSFNTETANATMVFELTDPYVFGAGDISMAFQIDFDYRDPDDGNGCYYPGTQEIYADLGLGAGFNWYGETNTATLSIVMGCTGSTGNAGRMTKTVTIQHVVGTYPTITIQKWRWTSANTVGDPMTVDAVSGIVSGFTDITGKVLIAHSSDYGATTAAPVIVGATTGGEGGFNCIVIGDVSLVATDGQVKKATTLGGAYADDGTALTGSYPMALLVPSYQWNSTTTTNYSTATPHYLVGSAALVSGASLWRDTGSRTDITPTISGNKGLVVAPDAMANWRGTHLALIMSFGGTRHLITSIDAGTNWVDRGAVNANANMVKTRRRATSPGQIFFTSNTQIGYSSSFGSSIVYKNTPSAGPLKGVEAWG